jgi:hypothetical protein
MNTSLIEIRRGLSPAIESGRRKLVVDLLDVRAAPNAWQGLMVAAGGKPLDFVL